MELELAARRHIFTGPMAITTEALRDLRERAALATTGPLAAEIAKGTWRASSAESAEHGVGGTLREVEGGIGVINVSGPLFKKSSPFVDEIKLFLGGTSYDSLWQALEECQTRGLKGVLFRGNSPGGEVGGAGEFADYVYSLRGKFPIWTYVETQCASAALWFASQSERIVSHETGMTGWVGVIRGPIIDDSLMLERLGIQQREVVSKHAKAKRTIPLDDEVLSRIQVQADDLGDCFEAAMARGRAVGLSDVAERFGGGDGMIASKALDADLIDEIGSFDSTLVALRERLDRKGNVSVQPSPTRMSKDQARAAATDLSMSVIAELPVVVVPVPSIPLARASAAPIAAPSSGPKRHTRRKNMATGNRAEGGDKDRKGGDAKRAEAEGKRAKADAKRADAKKAEAEADEFDKGDKKDDAKAKRAEAKRCEAEADEMDADADKLESAADELDHEEPDGDEKKALAALSGLRASASVSAHAAAIEARMLPREKVTALESKVAAIETERAAEKKSEEDKRLNATADRAEELGYFAGLDAEKAKVKRDRFLKIARNEPDAAEEIIASLPAARVTGRQTAQGNPTGGRHSERPRIDAFDQSLGGRRVNHGDVDTVEKGSPDLMARARKHAKEHNVSLEEAMVAVVRLEPALMQ